MAQLTGMGMGSFVGRVVEISRLLRAVRAAQKGMDARVAVITGAPGMGKTRLAEELGARGRRAGARVAVGRAWDDGGAPPLWPWQAVLRDLGAPADLLAQGVGRTVDERFARFAAVFDHLTAVASASPPLVIILEDVHLADEATLLLSRFVLREQRNLPLLLVLTRRDDATGSVEVRALLSEIERRATMVPLSGLPLDAVRAYLATLGVRSLPADLLQALATISRGNPLHLRQLVSRSAIDGDMAGALERGTEAILGRLSPTGKRIVAIAAVLGQDTSTIEIAVVAESPIAAVDAALDRARASGLLEKSASGGVSFVHDLIRQAVLSTLTYAERLDVHARAASVLRGRLPAQVLRRTHHSLEAAPRSARDAEVALSMARETARSLRTSGGLEAAAGLLQRTVEAHAAAGLPTAAAPLAVEHAESVLACGRLAESRPLFERAAKLADSEDDAESLARAALGLGGIWLREHRLADETTHVSSLQRRALAALPEDGTVLRARLQVRIAAEDAYRAGLSEFADAALETVRQTGDPHALAEALSLYHHVLAGPEHSSRRLPIAEALIAAAVEAEDILLTLVGLCWRAADRFLLGDPRGCAALEELRVRAEALQCRSILFIVRAMEVMLLIRAGRLDDAEAAAKACYALGEEVGDVDALAYYGGQLAAIRVFQGREAELADFAGTIASSPTLIPERERSFALAAAMFALRAGRPGAADAELEQLARDGVGSVRSSSSWLTSMLAIVELAAARHDAVVARSTYEALLPYAGLPIMASLLAVVCFGSAHRLLGMAAATFGEFDRAVEHFASAVTANERLGHRPAAIQSRAELGLARIARAGGNDDCGRALVEQAIAAAGELGMSGLASRWRVAAGSERRTHRSAETATLARAQRGYWRVSYGDQLATVADRVGLRYLAQLLAAPDQSIPALVLVLGGHAGAPAPTGQHVLDDRTIRALRARIANLQQQQVLAEEEERELRVLTEELGRVRGLGGRPRTFADVAERARTAVRKAIKRAIEEISIANPAIGEHLAASVSTGMSCCYSAHRAD